MKKSIRHHCIFLCTFFLVTVGFCQTDGIQSTSGSTPPAVNRQTSAGSASQEPVELGQEIKQVTSDTGAQQTSDNDLGRVVVNVWSPADSKAKEHDPAALSRGFAVAALNTASRMQLMEHKITNSVKMGFPLGEFWIQTDFDSIDDSLRLASLSAANDADTQALQQLEAQRQRLRLWCDWLIDQHRRLALADYYISPSRIDSDERFQNTAACTNFLLSMLASGKLANNDSCY